MLITCNRKYFPKLNWRERKWRRWIKNKAKEEKKYNKNFIFPWQTGVRLRVNNSFNCWVFSDFVYNLMKRKISNHFLLNFFSPQFIQMNAIIFFTIQNIHNNVNKKMERMNDKSLHDHFFFRFALIFIKKKYDDACAYPISFVLLQNFTL